MSDRRHTGKHNLNPKAVRGLRSDHPAIVDRRTLFPSTVVTIDSDNKDGILVSGKNNRKIGETVEKGKFKGYGIYCLTLEERATCPSDCTLKFHCYGNGMQYARRHRIDPENKDAFYDQLALEIFELLDQHEGVLIRLHVLGDFPDVEYVSFWKEILDENPNVACFGYTHWKLKSEIGQSIQAVKDCHPDRFRIRWSDESYSSPDGSRVLNAIPNGNRGPDGELVCPSQLDKTACCATCALCWEMSAKSETIGFILHGPKSAEVEAESVSPKSIDGNTKSLRNISALELCNLKPTIAPTRDPTFKYIDPCSLKIEESYQRDLSGKSIKLIRNIVDNWDWARFKPPIVSAGDNYFYLIDGQHTAIAAATHPGIGKIPVMVIKQNRIEDRAGAFVSQNTNRVAMSPLQVFHAEVAAGDKDAVALLKICYLYGADIPRSPPKRGASKVGQVSSVGAIRTAYRGMKQVDFERLVDAAVQSGLHPINSTIIRSLRILLTSSMYDITGEEEDYLLIAQSLSKYKTAEQFEKDAVLFAAEQDAGKYYAAAGLIYAGLEDLREKSS